LTPRVLTSSKFLPTQGIVAAACVNPRFVAEYRHSVVMAGVGGREGKEQMVMLDEIGQEKQRISERLARLDGERTKLGNQLNELEIAKRILTRFGGTAEATEKRSRGRKERAAPAAGGRRARGGQQ